MCCRFSYRGQTERVVEAPDLDLARLDLFDEFHLAINGKQAGKRCLCGEQRRPKLKLKLKLKLVWCERGKGSRSGRVRKDATSKNERFWLLLRQIWNSRAAEVSKDKLHNRCGNVNQLVGPAE